MVTWTRDAVGNWTDRSAGMDACWPWIGTRNSHGYGCVYADGRTQPAHRVAVGASPSDEVVMHLCDNPPCVNPAHLRVGTHAENIADRDAKGRHAVRPAVGEASGSAKLTDALVREIRARAASGDLLKNMAAEFSVAPSAISRVVARKTWRHVV